MNEYRKRLMPNVYLTVLPARKFKTGCLSAQFITALDRDRASYNALLPAVLNRGTMRYPDMESLSAAMDTLYGTTITTTVRKNGERQCVGFVASCIDDRFAPGGEKLLPEGKKSVTIRLTIGSTEKTLTSAEIEACAASAVKKLVKNLGAELRGK